MSDRDAGALRHFSARSQRSTVYDYIPRSLGTSPRLIYTKTEYEHMNAKPGGELPHDRKTIYGESVIPGMWRSSTVDNAMNAKKRLHAFMRG